MKYRMEIASTVAKDTSYFERLNMKIVEDGLLITAKSPTFGKYFEEKASKTTTGKASTHVGVGIWTGGRFFTVENPLPLDVQGFIRGDRDGQLFWDGLPNLHWFLHVDLARGFELKLPVTISMNNFEDYFMGCSVAIQAFHNSVLRQGELEAKFYLEGEE